MKRLKNKRNLKFGLLILAGGFIYYLLIRYTDFSIPCLFYTVTHLKCPGCGITHMIYELSFFHWKAAAKANGFLFFTSPLLAVLLFYEFFAGKKKRRLDRAMKGIAIAYIVCLVLWMIVRNRFQI